jgi:hypothetical protein
VDALEKWLNLIEGYFSVHNFSDREKIAFTLLKHLPHVKHWWENYWKKISIDDSKIYGAEPTCDFLWMRSRNNINLLVTMTTNTRDGPHCGKIWDKQCQSSQILPIPCAPRWVSNTLSTI